MINHVRGAQSAINAYELSRYNINIPHYPRHATQWLTVCTSQCWLHFVITGHLPEGLAGVGFAIRSPPLQCIKPTGYSSKLISCVTEGATTLLVAHTFQPWLPWTCQERVLLSSFIPLMVHQWCSGAHIHFICHELANVMAWALD